MRLALASVLLLGLAACTGSAPETGPPEGWVADGTDRWYRAGTDTSVAFRDLSTISAMGVAREDDGEFVRWAQEEMTALYRTNPEVVDSVFGAEFMDDLQAEAPAGDDYAEAAQALVARVGRDFYQRYNPTQKIPRAEPMTIPDSLASVTGAVVLQVYVDENNQPLAVQKLEGTGTSLDAMMMRDAATASYTDAWVRETAGSSEGVKVATWLQTRQPFNE